MQRKRKHSVQVTREIGPIGFVGVNNNFGVRIRAKEMAARFEILAQLTEIVDLAIEDHADGLVLVEDRLAASGKVDDGEPPHAQRDAVAKVQPFRIRPAMDDRRAHGAKLFHRRRDRGLKRSYARDAAHVLIRSSSRRILPSYTGREYFVS